MDVGGANSFDEMRDGLAEVASLAPSGSTIGSAKRLPQDTTQLLPPEYG
jgi:hypothetical protein